MFKQAIRRLKTIYSASPLFHWLVKAAASSPPYYHFTKRRVPSQIKKLEKGPFNLVIETSNFCNARCLMCPYRTMRRTKKIMEDSIFDRIVRRIQEENLSINKIFFGGLGEPLADSKLPERIREMKETGFWVKLYTNGSFLTPEISQRLVVFGLDEINVSFNGVNPDQYQEVMGLDFEKTSKNIETLIEIRKQTESQKPSIQISSIIIEKNEKDIKKHLARWQDKVNSVTVSLAHEWGGGVKISAKRKAQSAKLTYPCRSLWHTLNILSSGDFVICCRDYEGKYVLGNILTHSFAEILESRILESFRQANLKFSKEALPAMCRQCNFPYQDGIEWYLPRSLD